MGTELTPGRLPLEQALAKYQVRTRSTVTYWLSVSNERVQEEQRQPTQALETRKKAGTYARRAAG